MNAETKNAWRDINAEENLIKALDRLERKSEVMKLTCKNKALTGWAVDQTKSDWDEVLSLVMIAKRNLGLKSITQK